MVGVVAALVVLLVAFGTVVAALVPIALALVAVGVGLCGVVLLAGGLTISTAAPTIGAMVGLGVGIDYALFIVSRYRENRTAGQANAQALSAAMGTSGTAVFFAGGTVVLAMAALVLTGVGFLASIGLATSIVVLFAVATAITLLPAILSLLGDRIDAGRIVGRRRAAKPAEATAWWRLAHRISARPWPYLVAGSLLLLTLAAPALSLNTGFPDAGDNPTGQTERKAYDLLADGFGPGFNAPLLVVADLQGTGLGAEDVPELAERIAADPGIAEVGEPRVSADGDTVVLPTLPRTEPADPATVATLERVRSITPDGVYVTGATALTLDLDKQLTDKLPLFIGAILAASFLLLMIVFRSVVVPLKAVVMNLLSIGAAYGVVVAVFQWGWFGGLFGLDGTYRIASPLPVIFFAVLFGLSMDYEVFLVSRIREAFHATGDNAESVARGLASTGRVITVRRADHGVRVPLLRHQPLAVRADDRTGAGNRHRDRRHRRPDGPGAGDDGADGPGELVAARMARPAAAAPQPRERPSRTDEGAGLGAGPGAGRTSDPLTPGPARPPALLRQWRRAVGVPG